jgi:hypothetical protein
MTLRLRPLAAAALLVLPLLASAAERVLVLRTVEDERFPADPATCAAAPFQPVNVVLGASTWTVRTGPRTGVMRDDAVRFAGTATGCGLLTTTAPFAPQPFLIRFDLADGTYVASGTCTITSNDVPARGLLLLGCTLKLVAFPPGVLGGSATSASVFNLAQLPGFDTGSIWTLRIHDATPATDGGGDHGGDDGDQDGEDHGDGHHQRR